MYKKWVEKKTPQQICQVWSHKTRRSYCRPSIGNSYLGFFQGNWSDNCNPHVD